MKKLLISAAAVALLITPALAQQKAPQTSGQAVQTQKKLPRLIVGPGLIRGNDVYDCTGKYLGSDPDPNIRHQILREGDPSCSAQ